MKYIWQFGILLKRIAIFVFSIVAVFLVYQSLVPSVWQRGNILLSLIILWLVTAYFVLPKIHRFLSRIYVPDNFIGRTRTADGLLSDPVNLAINGKKTDFVKAMESAGWVQADKLTPGSAWKMFKSVVFQWSYPSAPVSDAFLFGNKQTLAFQMEVDNDPSKRHHVRFWKTPRGWYLPGGYKVDWLGAASYDEAVGVSLFTMQFTHSIDSSVDKERDFIVETLENNDSLEKHKKIEHFFNAHGTRNGFGSRYITDGSLVIADLKPNKAKK